MGLFITCHRVPTRYSCFLFFKNTYSANKKGGIIRAKWDRNQPRGNKIRALSLRDMPFMLFQYFIYLSSYLYPTESITRILFQISVFVQLNLGERYRKQCMDIGIKTCNHLIAWCGRFHIPIQFDTFGQRIGPD